MGIIVLNVLITEISINISIKRQWGNSLSSKLFEYLGSFWQILIHEKLNKNVNCDIITVRQWKTFGFKSHTLWIVTDLQLINNCLFEKVFNKHFTIRFLNFLLRLCFYFYWPQMKFANVMFSQVSVCSRGVSAPLHAGILPPGADTPPGTRGRHPPPEQTPPPTVHAGRYGQFELYNLGTK